jgi:hypothetical protein
LHKTLVEKLAEIKTWALAAQAAEAEGNATTADRGTRTTAEEAEGNETTAVKHATAASTDEETEVAANTANAETQTEEATTAGVAATDEDDASFTTSDGFTIVMYSF